MCAISSGGDVPKDNWSKTKTSKHTIPIFSNGIDDKGLYGYTNIAKIDKPAITIAGRGAGVGNSFLRNEPYYPIVRLISLISKSIVNVRYLYYCVQRIEFKVPKSGIPQLTVPMVSEYKIPVPPIDEQERIVSILDRFDKLCNDISEGLPAEIEARRKQCEYYRDKLLSFEGAY